MDNRKIILDVETTGLSYLEGDKIIEIACLELINDEVFGKEFHFYINPQKKISAESTRITGITDEAVATSPIFKDIAQNLIEFIGNSLIIAHNAEFDRGFVNFELKEAINFSGYTKDRYIDTLVIARQKFPVLKNTLDALAQRFNIDTSSRLEAHGALIDVKLLGLVYTKLINVNNQSTSLDSIFNQVGGITEYTNKEIFNRKYSVTEEELVNHNTLMNKILNK